MSEPTTYPNARVVMGEGSSVSLQPGIHVAVDPALTVVAGEYATDDGADLLVLVAHAVDADGNDATMEVAGRIAAALRPPPAAPAPRTRRVVVARSRKDAKATARTMGWAASSTVLLATSSNVDQARGLAVDQDTTVYFVPGWESGKYAWRLTSVLDTLAVGGLSARTGDLQAAHDAQEAPRG